MQLIFAGEEKKHGKKKLPLMEIVGFF